MKVKPKDDRPMWCGICGVGPIALPHLCVCQDANSEPRRLVVAMIEPTWAGKLAAVVAIQRAMASGMIDERHKLPIAKAIAHL